jgi:hypothetical protein
MSKPGTAVLYPFGLSILHLHQRRSVPVHVWTAHLRQVLSWRDDDAARSSRRGSPRRATAICAHYLLTARCAPRSETPGQASLGHEAARPHVGRDRDRQQNRADRLGHHGPRWRLRGRLSRTPISSGGVRGCRIRRLTMGEPPQRRGTIATPEREEHAVRRHGLRRC